MKVTACILGLWADRIGEGLFAKLWERIPEARQDSPRGPFLDIMLPVEDPRVREAQELLAEAGVVPWSGQGKMLANHYWFHLRRKYDVADYEATAFLEPQPRWLINGGRRQDGLLSLEVEQMRMATKARIGGIDGGAEVFVSASLRRELEGSGLAHLRFKPIYLHNQRHEAVSWEAVGEEFLELRSDLILPAADPACLRNERGEPYREGEDLGCYRSDGFYLEAEFHYRRKDLEGALPFGVALTREKLGPAGRGERILIASKAFYRFCRERRLKMRWMPVRVVGE